MMLGVEGRAWPDSPMQASRQALPSPRTACDGAMDAAHRAPPLHQPQGYLGALCCQQSAATRPARCGAHHVLQGSCPTAPAACQGPPPPSHQAVPPHAGSATSCLGCPQPATGSHAQPAARKVAGHAMQRGTVRPHRSIRMMLLGRLGWGAALTWLRPQHTLPAGRRGCRAARQR